jgi:non-ribosomal peptide synthetase component E (peptide arylation enzyme)
MFYALLTIIAAALLAVPAAATTNLSRAIPTMQPMALANASLIRRSANVDVFDNMVASYQELAAVDLMSESEIRALSLRSVRPAARSWQLVLAGYFMRRDRTA